jgi:hypothetical protein
VGGLFNYIGAQHDDCTLAGLMHQSRSGLTPDAALLLVGTRRWRSEAAHEILDRSDCCGEHNLFQRLPATN